MNTEYWSVGQFENIFENIFDNYSGAKWLSVLKNKQKLMAANLIGSHFNFNSYF